MGRFQFKKHSFVKEKYKNFYIPFKSYNENF